MSVSPWWAPERHADRRPALLLRGRIKAVLRAYFEAQGFSEVECGALAVSPGNEAHLSGFATAAIGPDGARRALYLHTSPEFAAKKLLAAGEIKIFDFARVFRNRESGPLHALEFTMLEWYRAKESYEVVMADSLTLLRLAAETAGVKMFSFRGSNCDPRVQAERLTVAEAFSHHAGIDLMATLSDKGEGDRNALATRARRGGFAWPRTTAGGISSARFWWRASNRVWASNARQSFTNIRAARRRWHALVPMIRVWPNALSFMLAGWNWRMALAN